jgi:choline dehydrogenase-like flavoprotein
VIENWQSIIDEISAQNASAYLPPQYTGPLLAAFEAQRAILLERFASSHSAVMETPIGGASAGLFVLEKPLSRGSVNLDPLNPLGEPIVDFQTLSNPADVQMLTEMFRYLRKWLATPSNQQLGAVEIAATANITTDAEIEAMLREGVTSSFAHPSGANAMMPREMGGVVGCDLLVYGVEGLSVVDSSIMPLIPGTHLSATVYAVAEKVS